MEQSEQVRQPLGLAAPTEPERAVRLLVLLSGAFLVVQVLLADYADDSEGARVFWLSMGSVLLWLVFRKRSRVARGMIIVLSWTGAVVFGLSALGNAHAALLVVAFLGQALPLMVGPVRRHVQSGR